MNSIFSLYTRLDRDSYVLIVVNSYVPNWLFREDKYDSENRTILTFLHMSKHAVAEEADFLSPPWQELRGRGHR